MNKLLVVIAAFALAGCAGGGPGTASAPAAVAAPPAAAASSLGDFPDPFVLADGATYYAYATNSGNRHVQVARSTDLRQFTPLPDAMPSLAPWVRASAPDVWAPEVIKVGAQYLLYYTARDAASGRQCIGVAAAAAPAGPFVDTSAAPFLCQLAEGGTIDASPYAEDGKLYLYFKNDGNCCAMKTHIYVQELRADGLALAGSPVRLLSNERPWEGNVIEAPGMFRQDGRYLLFYSANDYSGSAYATGYAECAGPLGPCKPRAEGPFLMSRTGNAALMGPGHQHVFKAGDQTLIAYHAWELLADGKRGQRRFMYLDKLTWRDGVPVVGGPTMVP